MLAAVPLLSCVRCVLPAAPLPVGVLRAHLRTQPVRLCESADALEAISSTRERTADTKVRRGRFSASQWHRDRRSQILAAHPEEVGALLRQSDAWVLTLGSIILPAFAWELYHAADQSWAERVLGLFSIGSLRANWAVYSGHAISHGRWMRLVGPFGSHRFNLVLAAVNAGHLFQVTPSYWLLHQSHHTKLGSLPLREARQRAKQARQTDGDLGIATRLFSPPARKYRLLLECFSRNRIGALRLLEPASGPMAWRCHTEA
jgi:hypothetical protein